MSNLIDSTPDEPFAGLEPAAPAPAPEPAEPATQPEPDMFDRSYVEELRREAAGYRTRLREVESYFDGYSDDEREALGQYLQLSRAAEQGDPDAIQILEELFAADEPDFSDEPEGGFEFDEDYFRTLARQEAEFLYQQEEAQRAQVEAVQSIQSRAEQMGYQQGSEDYILLLKFANDLDAGEHSDLLASADQQVKAYRQQIIDAYISGKQQQADGPRTFTPNGTAPNLAQTPTTLAEARQALHDRLVREYGR